jgi:hypothetical protein
MPIQIASAVTMSGVAAGILNYCTLPNPVVALGGDLAWLYPDIPAPPSIFLTQLPAPIGYVPVVRRTPIVKDAAGDIPVSLDEAWQTLPLDQNIIRDRGCRHVMIEARIPHDLLPAAVINYYTVGLYIGAEANPAPFTLGEPSSGYLDLIQNFGQITRAAGSIHVIRMVRKF